MDCVLVASGVLRLKDYVSWKDIEKELGVPYSYRGIPQPETTSVLMNLR